MFKVAQLDFLGGYLPSLSITDVAMIKDMGKRLPQLYYNYKDENFLQSEFAIEHPHYSLALFSSFICTCTFSKKIEFASKGTPQLNLRNMLITG